MNRSIFTNDKSKDHLLTQMQKDAHNYKWYKECIDSIDKGSLGATNWSFNNGIDEYRKMLINYQLYNNIIDHADFEHICRPYGDQVGELPAHFTNRDICSSKIKAILGIENKKPFRWGAMAINKSAVDSKLKLQYDLIREYVLNEVTKPIQAQVQAKYQAQQQGQDISPDQMQKIQEQINAEVQSMTPPQIKDYIETNPTDISEIHSEHVLSAAIKRTRAQEKFRKGLFHACITAKEIYWVGIVNNNPQLVPINPIRFDYGKSHDSPYIEESEWCVCEYRMTASQVAEFFTKEMKRKDLNEIYKSEYQGAFGMGRADHIDDDFNWFNASQEDVNTVRVVHCQWRSLKKVGFLSYQDQETGEVEEITVDETYVPNYKAGDLKIDWQWIPEVHEGWKVGKNKYYMMGPVKEQYRDIDNIYDVRLSYVGAAYDNVNSRVTSIMDRLKPYQYLYNVILYRVELLMASDKGKKLLMNIRAIPKSANISTEKWLYFMDANNIAFYSDKEEGMRGQNDAGSIAKEVDLSLAGQIDYYVRFAEFIEQKAGQSIGITKTMEGNINQYQAVGNTQQSVIQSSYIIEPFFDTHTLVKRNVLQRLLEVAKIAYQGKDKEMISYMTDDMIRKFMEVDIEGLIANSHSIFVENSSKAARIKDTIENLSQAYAQAGKIGLSDIISVLAAEGTKQAEQALKAAEKKNAEEQKEALLQAEKIKQDTAREAREFEREKMQHEKEIIILKEKERRKTEIKKQAMLSAGFNENKDVDNDGQLDVLEIAKDGINADITVREQLLKEKEAATDRLEANKQPN